MKNSPLTIGNITIQPGERITLALPTPELYTCAPIYIPVHVIHGKKAGPILLISGSLHGDELNGLAISHQFLKLGLLSRIRGTVIVIPTLNIYGMMTLSRNLPDRRDLEGSFPGSKTGSFASRLAYFLGEEIFCHITHCIDLHTGEPHIAKFPQVLTCMEDSEAKQLAEYFQAPVILNAESNVGLLWLLKAEKRVPTIVYQVGEALRLDVQGIKMGVKGIVRVMRGIDMLSAGAKGGRGLESVTVEEDLWLRAPSSGLCQTFSKIGTFAQKGTKLASIADPFGTEQKEEIFAPFDGILIGRNYLPILNEGEPIFQLAKVKEKEVEMMQDWAEEGETAFE